MNKEQFNPDSQLDFNAGFVEVSANRTDFADPTLGEKRLFNFPGLTEHLGGLGILKANLDSLESERDEI